MIPTYFIEDLDVDQIDELIEKGVVFNVTTKASLLPAAKPDVPDDTVWDDRANGRY